MTNFNISKTTLNGLIAFFIAAVPLAQAYPGLHIPAPLMAWLSFAAGLARLSVGLAQKDADKLNSDDISKAAQTPKPEVKP